MKTTQESLLLYRIWRNFYALLLGPPWTYQDDPYEDVPGLSCRKALRLLEPFIAWLSETSLGCRETCVLGNMSFVVERRSLKITARKCSLLNSGKFLFQSFRENARPPAELRDTCLPGIAGLYDPHPHPELYAQSSHCNPRKHSRFDLVPALI